METTVIKTETNIKDLNVNLTELYSLKYQLNIHISDTPHIFHVILKDFSGYDCKISSFGMNLYARTKKGVNQHKYNDLGSLQRELKKLIHKYIDVKGEITFSLTKEILHI